MDVAIKSKPAPRMTLEELSQTAEIRQLSLRMREWVRAYVQSFIDTGFFDPRAATQAVYQCHSAGSVRASVSRLIHNPKIQKVVQLFLNSGKRDIDFDLEEIQKHLDAAEPGSVAAQRLLALKSSVKRGTRPEVEEPDAVSNPKAPAAPQTSAASTSRVPPGCRPARSRSTGELKGYLTPDGEFVSLAAVEAVR